MNIRKGDNIIVTTGREKGKQGKVIQVLNDAGRVVIEGLQIRKRHMRPRKSGEKGQTISMPSPMDVSNVMLVCSKCSKPTRVGRGVGDDKSRTRTCKKCKEII